MSARPSARKSNYGIKEFDLGTSRTNELIQTKANTLSILNAPSECYVRIGNETSPKIDLRDFQNLMWPEPFGAIYIDNPANSGTLKLLLAEKARTRQNLTVATIDDTVDISDEDGRDLGDVDIKSGNSVDITDRDARDLGDVEIATSGNTVDLTSDITRSVGTLREENATAFENGTSLASGGSLSNALSIVAADNLSGSVTRATTSYDLKVEWKNASGTVIETETIGSGVAGGTQTTFDVPARSPQCNVVVADAGSGSGAVDLTAHMR